MYLSNGAVGGGEDVVSHVLTPSQYPPQSGPAPGATHFQISLVSLRAWLQAEANKWLIIGGEMDVLPEKLM